MGFLITCYWYSCHVSNHHHDVTLNIHRLLLHANQESSYSPSIDQHIEWNYEESHQLELFQSTPKCGEFLNQWSSTSRESQPKYHDIYLHKDPLGISPYQPLMKHHSYIFEESTHQIIRFPNPLIKYPYNSYIEPLIA